MMDRRLLDIWNLEAFSCISSLTWESDTYHL